MSTRADYVAGLKRERAFLEQFHADKTDRIAQVDAELARFADEPAVEHVETAVPGPASRSRARARKE